jgi:hypothetical protein
VHGFQLSAILAIMAILAVLVGPPQRTIGTSPPFQRRVKERNTLFLAPQASAQRVILPNHRAATADRKPAATVYEDFRPVSTY